MTQNPINLEGEWAGRVYGTNTGNLFVEFRQNGSALSGVLRFLDDAFGLVVYEIAGTVGDEIAFESTPTQVPEGVEVGNVSASAQKNIDGSLQGRWNSELGTGGTFQLFPHMQSEPHLPEQIYDRSVSIGSIRLYKNDLKELLTALSDDFLHGKPVVVYKRAGIGVKQFAERFLSELDSMGQLKELSVTIQEPEAHGINKGIVLDLKDGSGSELRAYGLRETWVLGKTDQISQTLMNYQNRVVTGYRKYGLNLNAVIFLLMIVAMPEFAEWQTRLIFVVGIVMLLLIMYFLHSKLIPNTLILPAKPEPGVFGRIWPTIVSWILAATAAGAGAWIFDLLKSGNG